MVVEGTAATDASDAMYAAAAVCTALVKPKPPNHRGSRSRERVYDEHSN
jgi:hypothetical protein